jgi:hypothetical protein
VIKIVDQAGLPVQGVSMSGITRLNGQNYYVFGVTDENGEAHMPSLAGSWKVNLNSSNLRNHGYREVPELEVEVSGTNSTHTVTVSPFLNKPASLEIMTANEGSNFIWQGTGEAGLRYIVEGSKNLEEWRELGRVVAESERFYLTPDPETASLESFFVRTRLQPETESDIE